MIKAADIAPLEQWPVQTDHPFIIAGPCSAETPEQVMHTATELASTGQISLLRAGIWKPRTRPGSFQGIGAPALKWLKEASLETGIPCTTEVANDEHVEAALKAGIDVLWIGARTTVNPFSVQEIADALKGVDIPVIVKNPINPDLHLWIGAIERFAMNGLNKLMALHRGFSISGNRTYRNAPMWEIPIALKAKIPELTVLCDPSHITGDRKLIPAIAQKAIDLGMYGLMVETHPSPDDAWSDAAQQMTPAALVKMLSDLHWRDPGLANPNHQQRLAELRAEIDAIDEQLLQYLSERMNKVRSIGEYKKSNDLTILQLERWKEILETRSALGDRLNLDESFINRYLELLHKASIREQSKIMNEGNEDSVLW